MVARPGELGIDSWIARIRENGFAVGRNGIGVFCRFLAPPCPCRCSLGFAVLCMKFGLEMSKDRGCVLSVSIRGDGRALAGSGS